MTMFNSYANVENYQNVKQIPMNLHEIPSQNHRVVEHLPGTEGNVPIYETCWTRWRNCEPQKMAFMEQIAGAVGVVNYMTIII